MKRCVTKTLALLLALGLLAGLCLPAACAAEGDTVTISSAEELLAFARRCTLDTWSQGKTVVLTADLDLSGRTFTPIPTFGGTFLGNGHTISGLRVTADGSHMGLFRYVQAGAVIRDLHVVGNVAPGGSKSVVGGIAGSNAGAIHNCTFQGTVRGEASVGGIAGQNEATGEITGCAASGFILGEIRTGGIAGRNLGLLLRCSNRASVNITAASTTVDLEDLADRGTLEQLANNTGESADTLTNSHTDTGGVVGYSAGVVQSCSNSGTVGYPHVGYNVGGIAGRQTGYLAGCDNSGTIYGRKDVGGVVGQGEPDVILDPANDTLAQLRTELDTLDAMVNQALDHTDSGRAELSAVLTTIGASADAARDSAKVLLDCAADFADGNITTINALSVTVTAALDEIDPALDDLAQVSDLIGDLSDALGEAMETLGTASDTGGETLAHLQTTTEDLQNAGADLDEALADTKTALTALLDADEVKDQEALDDALDGLLGTEPSEDNPDGTKGALYELADSLTKLGEAMQDMTTLLDPGTIEAMQAVGSALTSVTKDLTVIRDNIIIHREKLDEAYDALLGKEATDTTPAQPGALDHLEDSMDDLDAALAALKLALSSGQVLTGELGVAADQLEEVTDLAAAMGRKLKSAFEAIHSGVAKLREDGPFTFTTLGQEARDSGEDLYAALTDLSGELTTLQNVFNDTGDTLSADLRAISRQMNKVFDLVLDALSEAQDTADSGADELIQDTTEEDIAAVRQGKITDCSNAGPVDGDRNVGGIVGSLSIEYDLDPEDDGASLSMGSTYETKAVLQDSVNRGTVTAKKDCAGGLVGNMDLGTTLGCQNYGAVTSTSGSYVGGVAGLSNASVRSSYAKCALSGTDYVGGIVGWGVRVTDNCAILSAAEGTEYVGAIAGTVDPTEGVLRNNRFVDTGIAGVDGISYAGAAEPVDFALLSQEKDIPQEFLSFTLTFSADGAEVARVSFQYGEDLTQITLPEVPEKAGYYGLWPAFDTSGLESDLVVEAEYTPLITLLASREQAGKLPLALAEGQFTGDAALQVVDSDAAAPEEGGQVWSLALTGTDLGEDAVVPLRLLNQTGGKAALWQLVDGQWQRVTAEENGQYLLTAMTGTTGVFCVTAAQQSVLPLLLLLAAALVVLAAALLIRRARKKRRRPAPAAE
jgi:hypothetical protein